MFWVVWVSVLFQEDKKIVTKTLFFPSQKQAYWSSYIKNINLKKKGNVSYVPGFNCLHPMSVQWGINNKHITSLC